MVHLIIIVSGSVAGEVDVEWLNTCSSSGIDSVPKRDKQDSLLLRYSMLMRILTTAPQYITVYASVHFLKYFL